MVTSEIEVYQIDRNDTPFPQFISSREFELMDDVSKNGILKKQLIVEKGNLLTMYAREAFDYALLELLLQTGMICLLFMT